MSKNFEYPDPRWTRVPGRWPTPVRVALSPSASLPATERVSNVTATASPPSTHSNNIHSPNNDAAQIQEERRAEQLRLFLRLPPTSTRIKEKLETGLVESKIGKFAASATAHYGKDLFPRLPDRAVIGVDEDTIHKRDSYIDIVNDALNHSRTNLKSGERPDFELDALAQGDQYHSRNSYLRIAREAIVSSKSPTPVCRTYPLDPFTEPFMPSRSGADAYMHLLDTPLQKPIVPEMRHKQRNTEANLDDTRVSELTATDRPPDMNRSHKPRIFLPDNDPMTGQQSTKRKTPLPGSTGAKPADALPRRSKPTIATPIHHEIKAKTYHGFEQEKVKLAPKPKTYPEEEILPSGERMRVVRTDCGNNTTLVGDDLTVWFTKAPPESPGTQSELYRDLSDNTRELKAEKKARRRTGLQSFRFESDIPQRPVRTDPGPVLNESLSPTVTKPIPLTTKRKPVYNEGRDHAAVSRSEASETHNKSGTEPKLTKLITEEKQHGSRSTAKLDQTPTDVRQQRVRLLNKEPRHRTATVTTTADSGLNPKAGTFHAEDHPVSLRAGLPHFNPKAPTFNPKDELYMPKGYAPTFNPKASTFHPEDERHIHEGPAVTFNPNPKASTFHPAEETSSATRLATKPVTTPASEGIAKAAPTARTMESMIPGIQVYAQPTRTLSEFHRTNKIATETNANPVKFGDTHLTDPATDWQEKNRRALAKLTQEREEKRRKRHAREAREKKEQEKERRK